MLVLLILASGYYFYKLVTTKQKKFIPIISVVSFLASATHYIGWYLSLFFILFFSGRIIQIFRSHKKVEYIDFVPLFLLLVMPLVWLTNAYLKFASPLYPFKVAQQMQSAYMGQLDYWDRALSIPRVMLSDVGILTVYGSICLIYYAIKKDIKILISIPGFFVLLFLWLTTVFGASNPYQEPRYLVFYGWIIYPLIISFAKEWIKRKAGVVIIAVLFSFYIIQSFAQLLVYENSFKQSLLTVALEIRPWCDRQSKNLPIIMISNSFAESGVLPLLSGCPEKIIILRKPEFDEIKAAILPEQKCTLIITKSKSIAIEAIEHKMTYKKLDRYFIFYCTISADALSSEQLLSAPRIPIPLPSSPRIEYN